jgi:glycosyltransferase involved in cell wall biosynthesis
MNITLKETNMISLILPSYNNLRHLKNVYTSIKKHAPEAEVVLLDDGSNDGTWEWIQQQDCIKYRSEERVGHTILYDKGIELATNDIVGILHADMILGPNYIQNILKHLKPGKVVCATRIEPPLHPEGKEKIIKDFGLDFDTLNIDGFESYCLQAQDEFKNQTTKGMFAPWVLYKKDFQAIGGHDPLFAPFPYEDSDIFQRWILAGYELVQSRDAFVYHLTCRGHRWTEQVGKDDDYFKYVSQKAARNYIRKWGNWIRNDEYQHPIIPHKYDIGFIVHNCNLNTLAVYEPWCSTIYINDEMGVLKTSYYELEQNHTLFNLKDKIKLIGHDIPQNEIIVEFDATLMNQDAFNMIMQLSDIITDSGEVGSFELDIFKITVNNLNTYEHDLVHIYNK